MGDLLGAHGSALVQVILVAAVATSMLSTALAGPRITAEMAGRGDFLRWLAARSPRTGVPVRATLVQAAIASGLVLTGTFETLLAWTTCVMLTFGALVAAAQVVLRIGARSDPRRAGPLFRDPFFPLPALLYGASSVGILAAVAGSRDTQQVLWGVLLVLAGLPIYAAARRRRRVDRAQEAD